MVRRVKSYLSELSVSEDERKLDELSIECEPAVNTGSTGNMRGSDWRRQPSPSPSSGSSLSNNSNANNNRLTGPKFGTCVCAGFILEGGGAPP